MDNYSLTDIAAVTGGTGTFGGNSWIFLIVLFFLFGMGNFNNRGNAATTEDLASGFNFSALQNKGNETLAAINGVNQNLGNAICNLGYQNSRDFASLSQQLSNCCCETQRNIDGVRFDMANYTAAINANTTASTQKILDKLNESENRALTAKVQQLELQQALCGVPRVSPFGYGIYPTFGTCNPCNNTMNI